METIVNAITNKNFFISNPPDHACKTKRSDFFYRQSPATIKTASLSLSRLIVFNLFSVILTHLGLLLKSANERETCTAWPPCSTNLHLQTNVGRARPRLSTERL